MKLFLLAVFILLITINFQAITVFVDNGKEYSSNSYYAKNNRLILNDEGVDIHIPLGKIRAVIEKGTDVTRSFLARAKVGFGVDSHFLLDDDLFISESALGKNQTMQVYLAKMLEPATEDTDLQAQFLQLPAGTTIWTKYWWNSKEAVSTELKVGDAVIYFEAMGEYGSYRAPVNEDEARNGIWKMAKVTDISTIYMGYCTISGGYSVELANLRVIHK